MLIDFNDIDSMTFPGMIVGDSNYTEKEPLLKDVIKRCRVEETGV